MTHKAVPLSDKRSELSRRRLHAVFVIPTLHGGGAERVTATILRHLDRSKFRLSLIVIDGRGAVVRDQIPPDIQYIDLRCGRVRDAWLRLPWRLRLMKPDVVLATVSHLVLALAMLRPVLPKNVRLIGRDTVVLTENLHNFRFPAMWSFFLKKYYPKLDCMICQSQDIRQDLIRNWSFPRSRLVLINNPVDFEWVHARSLASIDDAIMQRERNTIQLVAAGRLVDQKGFDLLLQAIALCEDLRLRLTILGEGPREPALRAQAQQLGLADRVRFAGHSANPFPIIAQADAFVLSSRFEGFPNVVLESLACGTPVIATPAPGGTREILEGISGCKLAASVSAEGLACAMREWIAGSKQRIDRNVVSRYEVGNIVGHYARVLEGH